MPGQAFQQWDFATILTGDQMGAFFTILNHGIFTDHGDKLTCGFIQPLEPKRLELKTSDPTKWLTFNDKVEPKMENLQIKQIVGGHFSSIFLEEY